MTKNIFYLLLIVISSKNIIAQTNNIDLQTLEKLVLMTSNQFEDWALNQELNFDEIINYSELDVIYYKKNNHYQLSFSIDKNGNSLGSIFYETSDKSEYTELKRNCTNSGYYYETSRSFGEGNNKVLFHIYESLKFELSFNIRNTNEFYGYGIGVEKKK